MVRKFVGVVTPIGIVVALFVVVPELRQAFWVWPGLVLALAVFAVAFFGQAKDIATGRAGSGQARNYANPLCQLIGELFYSCKEVLDDKFAPAFVLRLTEWSALTIAGGLLSLLF